jgi:hypothetical protein
MLRHRLVHGVDEDDVRLARREARLDQLLEQGAGIDLAADASVLRALELELGAVPDGSHELVGDEHAMVQVERLAVEVARGLPDLEEFLDLGVIDVEVAGGRTATQRALRDGERQAVHDPDERDDSAGLAVEADRLTDAADAAPIGADPAAARGEPDVLVPSADDAVEAVGHAVQIAADRKAATGAAVRQDRRRRHEPQLRDVIVDALRVGGIVRIGGRDAREQILVGLAGKQIAVLQRLLAEFGEKRIARLVRLHLERSRIDRLAGADRRRRIVARDF